MPLFSIWVAGLDVHVFGRYCSLSLLCVSFVNVYQFVCLFLFILVLGF